MQTPLERKVFLGFLAAVALLLFSGGAAWFSATRTTERFAQVDHTHRVLFQIESVLADLLNMQTSARGFLLTGEERFLEPFHAGRAHIQDSLPRLGELVADDPTQQERLRGLAGAADRLLALTNRNVEIRRTAGFEAAAETATLLEGKAAMDRIRNLVAEMREHEGSLLVARSAEARREARQTFWVTAVGGTVALSVVGAAAFWVRADLRARLRAEAERDRFFTLSRDLMCIVGFDGYFKRVNPAFTATLGWTEAELLARPFHEFLHPDDRQRTLDEVRRQQAEGHEVVSFDNRYVCSDGSVRSVRWNARPIMETGRIYAIGRDVTEEKAAEEALRRASVEIQDLYNRAPCGYHSIDAEGRFVAINDTELEWLGYTREEVVGRLRFRDLLTPESQNAFAQNFPQFLATGRVDGLEFEIWRRDGSTFFVSLSATAMRDEAGRFVQSRSTLHDVTARRAAERQLTRLNAALRENAGRLEAVNRELEAFSYSVSHDLRAPLRHAAGFAVLLEKEAGARLDAKSLHYLAVIKQSAVQMGRLIDDLLAFSRAGRAALQLGTVDHAALVADTIRQLGAAAARVAWQIGPLPALPGDPALLRQVWLNLLDNAVKYTGKSAAPRVEISAQPESGETVFQVRDNGAGFDPLYMSKLFQVFSRLHNAAEFEGTGIGLALVRRIIARHGGRTWAEGAPGAGATFHFSLPATPIPARNPIPAA